MSSDRRRERIGVKVTKGQRELYKQLALKLNYRTSRGLPKLAPMIRHVLRQRAEQEGLDVTRYTYCELLGEALPGEEEDDDEEGPAEASSVPSQDTAESEPPE